MSRRSPFGLGVFGTLVGLSLLTGATAAGAAEPLVAGTWELSLAGAYSVSHNTNDRPSVETVNGYYLVPHVGYLVTDEHGGSVLRGNFQLLLEPTLVRLDASSRSSTVGGASGLVRWLFTGNGTFRPYLEAGAGVLGGHTDFRQTTCDVNYILTGGPGVLVFLNEQTAVTLGYRFEHISNGGKCSSNLGLNSSMFLLGVSYFFR